MKTLMYETLTGVSIDGKQLKFESAAVKLNEDSRGFHTWEVVVLDESEYALLSKISDFVQVWMQCQTGKVYSGNGIVAKQDRILGNGPLIGFSLKG